MRRFLREPIVHFLLLGAVLFGVARFTGSGGAPGRKVIEITPGVIEHLATTFARTWQRPPTPEELAGVIRDHVREEVAYREGQALGLDRDDSIIRRRMRQKLEMLSEETSEIVEPDDVALEAYLRAHADRYAVEPIVAFTHVFINPARHAGDLDATLHALRGRLESPDATVDEILGLGDPTLLPADLPLSTREQVLAQFGDSFADAVMTLKAGVWAGPLQSAYGLHFVLVRESRGGSMPELAAVRDEVLRDWQADRTEWVRDQLYARLLADYDVVYPEGAGQPAGP